MYYYDNRGKLDIKKLLVIVLAALCIFCYWQGCSNKQNYNKERSVLNQDIKNLQNRFDSLQKVSDSLKIEDIKYRDAYKRDSVVVDSLTDEYNSQLDKAAAMENKANVYLNKYNSLTKGINKLENNKSYKTGDSLLHSLGEKIKN